MIELVLVILFATEPPPPDQATSILITQLGDKSFVKRQSAEKQLEKSGYKALGGLEWACYSPDPEVRFRAQRLVNKYFDVGVTSVLPSIWAMPGKARHPVAEMDLAQEYYQRALHEWNNNPQNADNKASPANWHDPDIEHLASCNYFRDKLRHGVKHADVEKLVSTMGSLHIQRQDKYGYYGGVPSDAKE